MAINIGQGTIIKMTITSTLTAITQVLEGNGPGITVPKVKTSNLASVAAAFRAGLPEADPLSFTIQYDPADTTHQALVAAASAFPQLNVVWNVIFNTAAGTDKAAFSGFLMKFNPKGFNQEDNLEADIEVQPTGLPTYT